MVVDGWIRDTAHHSAQSEIVHREECEVKEYKSEEEVPFPERLTEHASEHFREPEIDCSKDGEDTASEKHIVEVGHNEVSMVDEEIDRCRCHEDAAQAADDEHRNEGQRETHCGGKLNRPAPDGSHPVEGFNC